MKIVGLLICLLFALNTNSASAQDTKNYTNEKTGYRIELPSGWEIQNNSLNKGVDFVA